MKGLAFLCLASIGLVVFAERSVTTFVAITGRPSSADVERKLDELHAVGVDSFLFYPTSGLRMEYLGEDFFRCAADFAAGAERRGMKLWLYDEYNWPSGSCRGRVPAEKDRWRYAEVSYHRNPTGGVDSVLSYGPRGWVTLLEPDGVDRFVELTYGAYERHLAKWIRNGTVRGVFTDEPGHPVGVRAPPGSICRFRWWTTLPDDYRRATGRDFGADAARDAVDGAVYAKLLGERFRSTYFDRIRAVTDHWGVEFCGHLIGDNKVVEAVRQNGDPLDVLRGESLPGIDEISSVIRPDRLSFFLYALADHAISRNGKGGMAELFACGPADMAPERMRRIVWLCALHGVTRYFTVMNAMDVSWMEQMRGFTTTVGECQPWFAEFRTFLDEADRASAFARKKPVRDVAVRHPRAAIARSVWNAGPSVPLEGLLRQIELNGFTLDLIAPDERSDLPVVFDFRDGAIVDERSGRHFARPADAVRFLAGARPVAGRRPNVLLRRYEDGSRAELDLNPMPPPVAELGGLVADWQVSLDAPNRHRVNFDTNGVGRLRLAAPLKGLRFAVRQHIPIPRLEDSDLIAYGSMCLGPRDQPPPYRVSLDSRPLEPRLPCDVLRPAYDSLYAMTAPMDLSAGEHELKIVSGRMDDNYFLPVVIVAGDFVEREGALAQMPAKLPTGPLAAAGLPGYAGSVTYTAMVDVPAVSRLSVASGNVFTRVTLDGRDLGVRAWAPFEWEVPSACVGAKRRLEIKVYTSVVPLFGDPAAPGAVWLGGKPKATSGETTPGLLSVKFK